MRNIAKIIHATPLLIIGMIELIVHASYTIYEGSGHNDIITAPKYNDKFVEEIILFADNT